VAPRERDRGDLYWALTTINEAGEIGTTSRFECGYCGESLAVQIRPGHRTRLVQGTVPERRFLWRPAWREPSHPLWRCWLRMWINRER
jgi:hypothetical protein